MDRYGPLLLAQTFREPLTPDQIRALESSLHQEASFVYNHRPAGDLDLHHRPTPGALEPVAGRELALSYHIEARHRGPDPYLFLDFRAVRRWVRSNSTGRSVLNLFAYTCGAGLCAMTGGAVEVWNVDFSSRYLELGSRNLHLNGLPDDSTRFLQEDIFPVLWQLAGQPVKGRVTRGRRFLRLEPREFDLIVLDPPAFSKGPFGAVDVVRDYQSLFKPCLRIVAQGGSVVAVNHSAERSLEDFVQILEACARKAGRPLADREVLEPEEDFPSFDGHHPLKAVVCRFD